MAGHVWSINSAVGRQVAPVCRSNNWQNIHSVSRKSPKHYVIIIIINVFIEKLQNIRLVDIRKPAREAFGSLNRPPKLDNKFLNNYRNVGQTREGKL